MAQANPAGTSYIAPKPSFNGPAQEKGALSAEEFLDRMETMKEASNWDDQRTIQEAASGLHGDAFTWFYRFELKLQGEDHARAMKTNWATFKRAFKAAYFQQRSAADADLDWVGATQKQGQAVVQYLHNTIAGINENFALVTESVKQARPDPAHVPDAYIPAATKGWLAGLPDAQKPEAAAALEGYANFAMDRLQQDLAKLTTAKVTSKGARQDRVRAAIGRALRDGDDILQIIEKARNEETMLRRDNPQQQQPHQQPTRGGRGAGAGRGGGQQRGGQQAPGRRPQTVGELADGTEHNDGEHTAATTAQAGRGRGRGRGRQLRGRCFLCGEAGHSAHDCQLQSELQAMLQARGTQPPKTAPQPSSRRSNVQTLEEAPPSFATNNPYALLYPEEHTSGNE